ncbi:PREDICTED: thyrotropin-releasing hormone-degrading ectoenzyme-like [Priapulus caudatus]|uniref:Thyrotropin-releasing hormone-degrading ectoenzyme-like n=1 Tax=Priapulus caudatus TaxID=37621 RepID=A0ABM1E0W4_PRICU|nr:PREDICTED: thyrotropin-releasing hormone-degrading ectoenzyme-like [Priapulus caudatus]
MDVAQVVQLDSPSWMADVYEPTPPMSTYLLAFTVCDFPMRRLTTASGVNVRWFGDLVTPSWWDDLWLNEGFASYVSQLSAYEMEPLGNVDDMIIAREMAPALITDSLRASHPISAVVKDPEQIGEIFDDISYSKGASLIRMMQEILGETVFREGLKTFLRRHSYSHATTNDLWRALAEASAEAGISIDLTSIMKTWTAQMGYPLVRLTCDGSSGTVTASQERFLLLREEGAAGRRGGGGDQAEYRWEVPLTVTAFMDSGRNESRLLWLHEERERYEIAEFRDLGWCLGNFKMRGFFRMAYDEGNWEKIIHQMLTNHEVIDVISRTQLFNDAFWVARGDALSTVIPLRLSRYLAKETEVLPWWLALDSLKDMRGLMAWSRGYPDFLRYGVQLLSPLYDSLGWEPSEAQNALQRRDSDTPTARVT